MNKFFIIFIIILSTNLYAEKYSMRKCSLLPVTDTAGHALGYRVYERLEDYLKEGNWCDYESTASLLTVFSKYRERLAEHLADPNVLRTVINKLQVGSLIRVDMKFLVNSVELEMDVLGENGIDLYFKEKETIKNPNVENVSTQLITWLETYEQSIPYDGQVIGVLGDQVTFTVSPNMKKSIGQKFSIKRFKNKTRHKLLNTVVEWDSDDMGEGKIFNEDSKQALGIIKVYNSNRKIKPGDWVTLEEVTALNNLGNKNFKEAKEKTFGKLGTVSINMKIGSSSLGTSPAAGSVKMSGVTYGLGIEGEAWITRNYFVTGEFSKTLGNLTKDSGNPGLKNVSVSNGVLKVTGGYKYLPMGFFFGPQVNLYGGYVNYSYNIERSNSDGFGSNSLSGFLIGVSGNMPLQRGIRIFAKGEIVPFSEFNDEDNIFSSNKDSNSLHFEAGATLKYAPEVTLIGGIEITNNSADFSGAVSEVTYRDTMLKIGALFSY